MIKKPIKSILLAVAAFTALIALPVHATEITVYKSATCGCCKKWVKHLRDNGFEVNAVNVKNVVPYKIKHGVTQPLASCHTALVDGYTIEGHVPAADIKRLLKEKPKIKGLAVPGMPMGTPGMEGPRKDAYDVVTFDAKGKTGVYSRYK
jgi:hypothetical protein